MVDRLSSYGNYVRGIRGFLFFTGLWPGKKYNSAHRLVPYLEIVVCFSMACAGLNYCHEHSNNLNLLTKSLGIVISFLSAVPKVICFVVYQEDLVEVHGALDKYFEEVLADEDIQSAIFKPLANYVNPFLTLTILLAVVPGWYLMAPLISLLIQLSHEPRPLHYVLPYPGKYPWPIEGGTLLYYAHYTWQVMAAVFLVSITTGVDSLFGYYAFQIRATFRLMSHRMRNLNATDENSELLIRDCVRKHRILARCCRQLETVYGPVVCWISVTSAIIMCTLIFQASQTRVLTVRYAIFTSAYIILKLLQAFMYALYGSVIFTESEHFREAVYSCGWAGSGDKCLMNSVLMMLCHKPIILTGCQVLDISTNMFTGIVNTTMSYFFLLQTLDQDK